MTTESNFTFTQETIIYAGTFANGLKEKLYGLIKQGDIITAKKASVDAEYKPKGQRNATLTAKSNINCCVDIDSKGRAYFNSLSKVDGIREKECFEGVKKVVGDTFDWKDLLKNMGFSWNGIEKAWTR